MELGFVHIGMMKTASTYMQNIWLRDHNYSLSWKGNFGLLEYLRNSVKDETFDEKMKINIQTDMQYQKGQKIVVSNEGFSSAYMNETEYQKKIPDFIDASSRILGKISYVTPNLLIVVRDPVSWIKSVYVQAVKQGGSGSAQQFTQKQSELIRNGLDLEYIYNCYSRFFKNILIIPFEVLKDDESRFWRIICEKSNTPQITASMNAVNESLNDERVYLLSRLNSLSGCLLNTLEGSKEYNFVQEKTKILNTYANDGKWVHRRFMEFCSESDLENLKNILNIKTIPDDFLSFDLEENLKNKIVKKYNSFLEKYCVEPGYIDSYNQSLKS